MKLTLKYKGDVLALLETVQMAQAKAGDPWSDTKVSKLCFNHGEFVNQFKKWQGGNGGPTLDKVMRLEIFLRDQLGEQAYDQFLQERTALPATT